MNAMQYADAAGRSIRVGDGRFVPVAPGNRDYEEIIASGVVIAPYEPPAPTSEDVTAERDRRMALMPFGGKTFQFDAESQGNIAGAGTLALAAIISGAQAGDYRWASPDADFVWLASDNTPTTMDAQTMLAFAQAAASWKREHIYAARVIKDQSPIPADYTADSRWPD